MPRSAKFDAPLRSLLARLREERGGHGEQGRVVDVLVRGRGAFTPEQVGDLARCGAEVRTVAGDVLGASVSLSALDELAGRDYVVSVALSSPLFPERGARGGSVPDESG
ncbi:MAG TPA: hypothetical protein VFM54_16985 [Micromonosporaceae bacterium]|nr:hypothetical protein [Micromonosporaceae bacterium]